MIIYTIKKLNFKDQSEYFIRSLLPRKSDVEVFHNTVRHRGSIVMENKLAVNRTSFS